MADYTNWLKECVYRYDGGAPLTLYQGVGPGNTALIFYGTGAVNVEKLQDCFARHKGNYGVRVEWLFRKSGQILVSKLRSGVDENTMVLEGLGAGADNVHFDDGDLMEVQTKPHKLQDIADIFELEDIPVLQSGIVYLPRDMVSVNDEDTITQLLGLMDEVTTMDGIVNVTADFWISDEKLEKLM